MKAYILRFLIVSPTVRKIGLKNFSSSRKKMCRERNSAPTADIRMRNISSWFSRKLTHTYPRREHTSFWEVSLLYLRSLNALMIIKFFLESTEASHFWGYQHSYVLTFAELIYLELSEHIYKYVDNSRKLLSRFWIKANLQISVFPHYGYRLKFLYTPDQAQLPLLCCWLFPIFNDT